jgi:hypothetical protein
MQARAFVRRAALVIAICAIFGGMLLPASAYAGDKPPGVLPPHSNPHGASYAEWGGRWWAWAWTQPRDVNPVFDTTGEFCAQGQKGSVWFLAGAFIYKRPEIVTRNCTVPVGKALFIPMYNTLWATFKWDHARCAAKGYASLEECALDEMKRGEFPAKFPDEGMDPALRRIAAAGGMQLLVDGKPVDLAFADDHITSPYRVQSLAFRIPLPLDNMWRINETHCPIVGDTYDCYPYFGDGTYVMLAPLSAGSHSLRILVPGELDVTYNLTIQPKSGKGLTAGDDAQNRLFVPFVSTQP